MQAQPIDFTALENSGVISKEGAWYRLLKPNELPEHAQVKIREFEKDPKGIRVKFSKTSRAEKQLKKYEKRSRS